MLHVYVLQITFYELLVYNIVFVSLRFVSPLKICAYQVACNKFLPDEYFEIINAVFFKVAFFAFRIFYCVVMHLYGLKRFQKCEFI